MSSINSCRRLNSRSSRCFTSSVSCERAGAALRIRSLGDQSCGSPASSPTACVPSSATANYTARSTPAQNAPKMLKPLLSQSSKSLTMSGLSRSKYAIGRRVNCVRRRQLARRFRKNSADEFSFVDRFHQRLYGAGRHVLAGHDQQSHADRFTFVLRKTSLRKVALRRNRRSLEELALKHRLVCDRSSGGCPRERREPPVTAKSRSPAASTSSCTTWEGIVARTIRPSGNSSISRSLCRPLACKMSRAWQMSSVLPTCRGMTSPGARADGSFKRAKLEILVRQQPLGASVLTEIDPSSAEGFD